MSANMHTCFLCPANTATQSQRVCCMCDICCCCCIVSHGIWGATMMMTAPRRKHALQNEIENTNKTRKWFFTTDIQTCMFMWIECTPAHNSIFFVHTQTHSYHNQNLIAAKRFYSTLFAAGNNEKYTRTHRRDIRGYTHIFRMMENGKGDREAITTHNNSKKKKKQTHKATREPKMYVHK